MSDDPDTLEERAHCAPFHRHYYHYDLKKIFNDRGWAR